MLKPPRYPVPGDGGIIAYTPNGAIYHSLPVYMEGTFTKACKFWLIANSIALSYYTPNLDHNLATLEFAEATLHKLLRWAEESNIVVAEGGRHPHHVSILHIYLHCAIAELFRPLLRTKTTLKTFGSAHSTPHDVFTASLKQLRRHVIMHPLSQSSARYNIWWSYSMLHVANAALSDLQNSECLFFYLLCVRGFRDLSTSFPACADMVRGLLGAAMSWGAISITEAKEMMRPLDDVEPAEALGEVLETPFVNLDQGWSGSQDARLLGMSKDFSKKLTV